MDKYTVTYELKPEFKNINYIFERLTLSIVISTEYEPYKKYYKEFDKMFLILKKWINIYYNIKDITKINDLKSFDEFENILSYLMEKCLQIDTRYIEEISIWYNEFLLIWKMANEMKTRGEIK